MRLSGKVMLVTGASSGLGAAMVERFAHEGARVVASARRTALLDELVARLADCPGEVFPLAGDLVAHAFQQTLVERALSVFGRLDVLVNNAGMNDDFSAVGDMSDSVWATVLNLNLTVPFEMARLAMPHLISSHGSVINIASIGGTEGARAGVAYTASKHGLIGMTKHTAFNYATDGVRCNVICPGPVDTAMVQEALHRMDHLNSRGLKKVNSGMKNLPRIGEPSEIASLACFLASDEASFINGAVIVADGGWTSY